MTYGAAVVELDLPKFVKWRERPTIKFGEDTFNNKIFPLVNYLRPFVFHVNHPGIVELDFLSKRKSSEPWENFVSL